ncbi:NAD/ferredoxin-dependent reductase-like protein [Herbihabitans rhizosphaerae]|uniref:NAD/ferredoxin-dependent reductase-like protein n=1 Tax=Herbihabitans rhizosphaerae TaxID=1872711 RepID=A0A4Q7KCF1_9PSEU|nr:FAD-dependent oxidoreductase [Herbihabitans rhizosphaerae]RZS30383.1 NAD/ferredoxin-dependent reductase-like protein [Herbihabitans rhizosphaerae]
MTEPERIVIVGSGLAGASAAAGLREGGYSGAVKIIGQESHRPYELPALSKDLLLGDAEEPNWVHEAGYYGEHDIELIGSTAITQLHLGNRVLVDENGGEHSYDRLLLATGSQPRTLPVPGGALPGLHLLRTLDDSRELRATLTEGARVVVIGAGWIGCEVASAARKHGAEVTVVEPLSLPLHRVLGDTIAGVFRDLHAEHGVTWRLGTGVTELIAGESGEVGGVRLADGSTLDADVVVVAVGASPRTALARQAGLELSEETGGGVDTDATLRSSAPDVFAAGDIAAHFHPRYGRRVRVEHWSNAKDQGTHVAANLLGAHENYTASPYFFTDQYDLGMEYRGLADPFTDELVVRGDLGAREFTAFWLHDGAVAAAMNVNMWDDGDALQALVDNAKQVSADDLRTADLGSLV